MNRKQVSKPSASATNTNSSPQTPLLQKVTETDPLVAQRIYDALSKLPPGYRFVPSDVELILDYLKPKIDNKPLPLCLIHPVNLYSFHPRTLAERHLKHPDGEDTYYFSPRDRKYKNGSRPSRGVAGIGYWKATGSDGHIKVGDKVIGYTKTLVFYEGKAPAGDKTNWIMHEYRVCVSRKRTSIEDMKLDDWVLCKIREKVETVTPKNKNKKKEEANMNTNEGDTNTENAQDVNAVKDEEVTEEENTFVNEMKCRSSQNDFTQSHQDMGLPWPQPLNTSSQNDFSQSHQDMGLPWPQPLNTDQDMIYGSQIFYEELSRVPGTSYSNSYGPIFYEQWENLLAIWPECLVQDSSRCLNAKGSGNFPGQDRTNGQNK